MTVYVILAICIAIPFVLFLLYAMCAAGSAADDANRQAAHMLYSMCAARAAADDANRQAALDKAVEAAMTDAAKDRE